MPELTPTGCATRQERLLALMESQLVDAAFISDVRDIYYFTGTLLPADLPAMLVVNSDVQTQLIGPDNYEAANVDNHETYEWNNRGTRHPDPHSRMLKTAAGFWKQTRMKRLGVQSASFKDVERRAVANETDAQFLAIDEMIAEMQKRKDPDEVDVIRGSIESNLGGYDAVRTSIGPGVSELDVLAAGMQGAMAAAGEKVFHDGDYRCGEFNGPARNRAIEAGELYIVDAWTCYRGYWSDLSRTFVVGREPTELQQSLYDHIRWVQSEVPKLLRPGVDGTEVYRALDEMIRDYPPLSLEGLVHHGGHCIGVRAHEMPDINPDRGGILQPGNVICVEPGGYLPQARHGVRLENMYLITDEGCEDLCSDEVRLHRCG